MFLFFLFISVYLFGKKSNFKLFLIFVVALILFFSFNINYFNYYSRENYIDGEVEVIERYDNYSIVIYENGKYLIYNEDYSFYRENKIYLRGEIKSITNTYNSFYKYLNKKGVNYHIDYFDFYVLENDMPYNEYVINELLENKNEYSKSYLKLILFNVKDEYNKEFYSAFSVYSLTYLIAVSGFHIKMLLSFFKKVFHLESVGYCFVCFYLYLLDFSVSSYRAFLCSLLKKINKKFKFDLSNNDLVSLIGSVFLIMNPSLLFSYSFIFSFLSTFVLEIFRVYSKRKIFITIYIYLINVPIILVNYYKLNLSTIVFSSILSLPISFIYVFSFVFLFLDKFYLLYEFVMCLFNMLLVYLNKFNLILIFGKPSAVFIVIYYFILFLFFIFNERKNKMKFMYLAFVFMLLAYQYYKPVLNNNEEFYFVNVGQGDCSVFIIPNSKEAVLVDTGGSKYRDIANSKIIPFLESKGVDTIRSVIITHDDFDHNGALESLKNNFKVREVIDTSLVESVVIGNKMFKNLNVSDSRDNDGSMVLYGVYGDLDLLLMGDASVEIEKNIIGNIKNVDVVKVGHHGSNTSSSFEFLRAINGKIAIISVGKNNSYGHPHEEVLDSLNKCGYIILRTDENNDIGFLKNIFNLSFIDYFK